MDGSRRDFFEDDDWETDKSTHFRHIADFLKHKYGTQYDGTKSYLLSKYGARPSDNQDNLCGYVPQLADYVAADLTGSLDIKAKHENAITNRVVPQGWTKQDSYRIADIAYNMAKIVEEKISSANILGDSDKKTSATSETLRQTLQIDESQKKEISAAVMTVVRYYLNTALKMPIPEPILISTREYNKMRVDHPYLPRLALPSLWPDFKERKFTTRDAKSMTGEELLNEAISRSRNHAATTGQGNGPAIG